MKKRYNTGLVLGILSIPCGLLIALSGWVLGIIGIVLNVKHKDEEFWIQGMYIYDAICRVAPLLHAFSKSGTKPLPYVENPYLLQYEKEEKEENKEQRIKNEQLIARLHFEKWARDTAKRFNKENGKE